jgi:hypothetical protein
MHFHPSHLGKVLDKLWLFGPAFFFNMILDDFNVSLDQEIASSQSSHFSEAQNERLYSVVLFVHLSDGSE